MANIVMASSFKTLASSPSPNLPQNLNFKYLPRVSIPTVPSQSNSGKLQSFLLRLWNLSSRNLITVATVSIATALLYVSPSLAAETEQATLFYFNLTLLAIALEFVILMVALDKIYYTPLGKFMDERDVAIRESLNSVKDTSEEVKQLEDQASAVLKAARAEISAALNKMKKETSAELEEKLRIREEREQRRRPERRIREKGGSRHVGGTGRRRGGVGERDKKIRMREREGGARREKEKKNEETLGVRTPASPSSG